MGQNGSRSNDTDISSFNGTSFYGYGLCIIDPKSTPIVLSGNYSCPPRFYCPNTKSPDIDPISLPSMCPPTIECQAKRLAANFCPPQGTYEPMVS
jgi:hypothetical protein